MNKIEKVNTVEYGTLKLGVFLIFVPVCFTKWYEKKYFNCFFFGRSYFSLQVFTWFGVTILLTILAILICSLVFPLCCFRTSRREMRGDQMPLHRDSAAYHWHFWIIDIFESPFVRACVCVCVNLFWIMYTRTWLQWHCILIQISLALLKLPNSCRKVQFNCGNNQILWTFRWCGNGQRQRKEFFLRKCLCEVWLFYFAGWAPWCYALSSGHSFEFRYFDYWAQLTHYQCLGNFLYKGVECNVSQINRNALRVADQRKNCSVPPLFVTMFHLCLQAFSSWRWLGNVYVPYQNIWVKMVMLRYQNIWDMIWNRAE